MALSSEAAPQPSTPAHFCERDPAVALLSAQLSVVVPPNEQIPHTNADGETGLSGHVHVVPPPSPPSVIVLPPAIAPVWGLAPPAGVPWSPTPASLPAIVSGTGGVETAPDNPMDRIRHDTDMWRKRPRTNFDMLRAAQTYAQQQKAGMAAPPGLVPATVAPTGIGILTTPIVRKQISSATVPMPSRSLGQ
jgi:hypothetical protein